jgi:uncharacterized 2Fe-2S/4Fe-4S cluster protein (DUF4445 family)
MSPRASIAVSFEPFGMKSEFKRGTLLLDALKSIGLNIRSDCGGRGICGKCKVIAKDSSKLNAVVQTEKDRLSTSELEAGHRLACCSHLTHDATIFIPEESRAIARKFLIEGTERPVRVDPMVRKFYVILDKPSLSDVRSDALRLRDFLKDVYGLETTEVDYQLLKGVPEMLRKAEWKATVTVHDNHEIVLVESGETSDEAYGIAIDIGTSKILGYLSNLTTGDLIDVGSLENPQIIHGEDVISRISFASKGEGSLKEMQKLAVEGVNAAIRQVCKKSNFTPDNICEITVVGNTAMHHLFLGINPKYLGTSPYVPVVSDPINVKARELSLCLSPSANVHVLPVIAGFVGADAVADIVATEIYKSNRLSLVIDIGTNTEIVLGDKREMTACSCASGPAFEGAHIKCGMKAVTGAIERVQIERQRNYRVKYQTVGNAKPIGACGSAIIDAVANLLKNKLIDTRGIFVKHSSTPRLRTKNGMKEFVLVFRKEGATRNIVITQKDIEQVQLAKAAIYTGCHILMKEKHIKPEDITKVFVAGAFGNYINVDNAKLIGMLPEISTKRIRFVGNAAGAGARMALISKKHRRIASLISKKVQYIELALDPDFQREFASAMFLPNKDLGRFPSFRTDCPHA